MKELVHAYEQLKTRNAERDKRMREVALVRSGNADQVFRGLFPEGTWSRPIIANLIDVVARDVSEQAGVLPTITAAGDSSLDDSQRTKADKRTKIANYYVASSRLGTELLRGADQLGTYGFCIFRVEPNFKEKRPHIHVENSMGAYYDMDMVVNIALGRGSDEQRMMFLMQILAQQKEVIEKYGPNNPLVDLQQYRNTLAQVIELSGFQDPAQFVKEVDPAAVDAYMQQMSQQQKPMDPTEMLAQVQAKQIEADILIAAAKQELETKKAQADADFKRDQLMVDAMLKAAEIEAKYGSQVDMAMINAEVNRQRTEIQEMFSLQAQREQAMLNMNQIPQQAPAPQMMPPMPPQMM